MAAVVRGDRGDRLAGRLEDVLRSRYAGEDVLLTDSGTTALRLAIAAAVGASGRPVALPGYSCYDLATAAEGARAPVALYDVDPSTLGPDEASLEALQAVRPAAVVATHLFGYPVDVRALRGAIGDALLIEDAAQAAGGRLDGRLLGSWGSLSVLSFGRGKGMTGGGGGALLAHDERGTEALSWARTHVGLGGKRRGVAQITALVAQVAFGRPALYGVPAALPFLHLGETRYHPPFAPRRATAASLAVLERVIADSDREVLARTRTAGRLLELLGLSADLDTVEPVVGAAPGYLRLPVLIREPQQRGHLKARVTRLGVTPMYPMALAALPTLAPLLVGPPPPLPGADRLAAALITIPTHSLLNESDLSRIADWVAHHNSVV